MSHTVAIIGAGWYGCHIAATLINLGFDVTVFERNDRMFHEASGNNQFRLHLGFHYARHHGTRVQSRDGYMRFLERYPALSGEIPQNVYAVPLKDSLVDFATYKLVMTATGINFHEIDEPPVPMKDISGMVLAPERVLYIERSRVYFKRRLGSSLVLGYTVQNVEEKASGIYLDGQRYDFVIDATWGHFRPPPAEVFYEPTLLLYYEGPSNHPAITLVDGPLCSVYPTEDPQIYTLSSVVHTPMGHFGTADEARNFCRTKISQDLILQKRKAMEEQISLYLPEFRSTFRYAGPQIAIKTKLVGNHDDRSCYVYHHGRYFNVMSGKIDTIFVATERILSALDASFAGDLDDVPSTLKGDMVRVFA